MIRKQKPNAWLLLLAKFALNEQREPLIWTV